MILLKIRFQYHDMNVFACWEYVDTSPGPGCSKLVSVNHWLNLLTGGYLLTDGHILLLES